MPDSRIVDYLRQNAGKFPIESLKAALVKQGFPEADVEEAARVAAGGAPPTPPAPGEGGPLHPADAVVFGASRLGANAAALLKDAPGFFSRFDQEAPFGPAVTTVALWGLASGVLTFLMSFLHPSRYGAIVGAAQIVMLPIMAVILSWVAAGIFHVVCLILGGKGTYKGSYQVIAAMAALFPVSTLLGMVPYGTIPIQLLGLYLSVQAASAMHQVGKGKAWAVFGVLTAIGVAGSVVAQMSMGRLEQGMGALGGPAALGGLPQPIPPQAAQVLGQLGALGGQLTPEAQQAMQQAAQNPGAILQELTKYGSLAQPPAETLALLDAAGQAKLTKSWPTLSAPMRKSLIETLPSVPPADRNGFMDQMDAYTKDMNTTLQQSMKIIEQAQKTMQDQQGAGQNR